MFYNFFITYKKWVRKLIIKEIRDKYRNLSEEKKTKRENLVKKKRYHNMSKEKN